MNPLCVKMENLVASLQSKLPNGHRILTISFSFTNQLTNCKSKTKINRFQSLTVCHWLSSSWSRSCTGLDQDQPIAGPDRILQWIGTDGLHRHWHWRTAVGEDSANWHWIQIWNRSVYLMVFFQWIINFLIVFVVHRYGDDGCFLENDAEESQSFVWNVARIQGQQICRRNHKIHRK